MGGAPLAVLPALSLETHSLDSTWVFTMDTGIGSTLPVSPTYFECSGLTPGPLDENGSHWKYGLMSFSGTPSENSQILLKKKGKESESRREGESWVTICLFSN